MILPLYIKKAIPTFCCFFLILLTQFPITHFLFLPLLFIPIFYFSIFKPQILNAFVVFGLGLFADLISQTPFGLFSFVFVLLFFVARMNQLFLKELSFKNLWILFILCSGILLLVELFIFTICSQTIVNTRFLFQEYVVLILFYPLGFKVCAGLQNWIGEDD